MRITKETHRTAIRSEQIIDKAMTALNALSLDVLAGDVELRTELDSFFAGLEVARMKHQEVIDAAKAARDTVDPLLINRCLDRLGKLQNELERKNTELHRMSVAYDKRLRDAMTAREPVELFRPLDRAPTPEDEIRIARERVLINLEIERIQTFLGTSPFFDFSLLDGTALESFVPA
jgi:hypothetical protein